MTQTHHQMSVTHRRYLKVVKEQSYYKHMVLEQGGTNAGQKGEVGNSVTG